MNEFEPSADEFEPPCGHDAAVGYEVTFTVGGDGCGTDESGNTPEDAITSACDVVAEVVESDPGDADSVGCDVETCEYHHERVAERLRREAERHSGNPHA